MIKLYLSNDAILVWNADDIYILRKEHRIVGSLLGLHPYKPHQLKVLHLPLKLMFEEAKLLIEKGIAELIHSSSESPETSVIQRFYERQDKLCSEQIALSKEHRLQEIQMKSFQADAVEVDINKVKEISKEDTVMQVFTECPWKKEMKANLPSKYPSTAEDKLKFAVFKDLWEKNYFITNGAKFGGDFLVYAGDPLMHHSLFIVTCFPSSNPIKALDLVFYGRLGHQVKKTMALASFNDSQEVEFISLEYMSDNPGENRNIERT